MNFRFSEETLGPSRSVKTLGLSRFTELFSILFPELVNRDWFLQSSGPFEHPYCETVSESRFSEVSENAISSPDSRILRIGSTYCYVSGLELVRGSNHLYDQQEVFFGGKEMRGLLGEVHRRAQIPDSLDWAWPLFFSLADVIFLAEEGNWYIFSSDQVNLEKVRFHNDSRRMTALTLSTIFDLDSFFA